MRNKVILYTIILIVIIAIIGIIYNNTKAKNNDEPQPTIQFTAPAKLTYTVVQTYPHDTAAYTEGLEWYNGNLWESAGQEGKSYLVQYKQESTIIPAVPKVTADANLFAEGITILNDTVYQLSYTSKIVTLYHAKTMQKLGTLPWINNANGQGWGLTHTSTQLVASDGSNIIYFINPKSLAIERTINVRNQGTPVDNINELEYANGHIYANVFTTDLILKINPTTGDVVGIANIAGILSQYDAAAIQAVGGESFLNGIAYNPKQGTFYITGKNWPSMFEIKLP